jgi:hypothetical protein
MLGTKNVRYTPAVAAGLEHIYSLASCELENGELTQFQCRCAVCSSGAPDPCHCDGKKQAAKKCEGCRTAHEWAKALSWISDQLRRRGKAAQRPPTGRRKL